MEATENARTGDDAFSLYLRARSEWNRRSPSSLRKAIRYLDKAISLNGSFPLACAALADCYSILLDYGVLSPREGLTQARLAAGRALHWGPNLAESLAAAALVRQMDLDWTAAEIEFKAAIQAHPGYAVARQRYGLFLAWTERFEEGRLEVAAARTLDPHSPAIAVSTGWVDYYQGRHSAAIRCAEEVFTGHPGFSSAQALLSLALVQTGQPSRGADVLEEALSGEEENVSLLSLLAYARGRNGEKAVAEALLKRLRDWSETRYVSPYYLAVALLGLDDEGGAQAALEDAERERSPQLVYLATEPIFAPLRTGSGFRALMGRLRLAPKEPAAFGDAEEVVA